MILYTINGNYPDSSFAFTLTADDLGLAPTSHRHAIRDVTSLSSALSAKANTEHTHTCVTTLYYDNPSDQAVKVTLTATATGSVQPTLTLSGQTINIGYVSPSTGDSLGITDHNPYTDHVIVQLYGGTIAATDNSGIGFLVMEGNNYA